MGGGATDSAHSAEDQNNAVKSPNVLSGCSTPVPPADGTLVSAKKGISVPDR